ncbi:hypothetical protein D9611_006070 [Ephemerocybe angulata]|uniref:Fungal-type protein kinase domain-containing protein n=1 Tax=Ephemerocybe angulata TaxID=980116 RepID=A0A8H5FKX3_9AGAR|nr:hypothetical protein D9611_006070 [Tulosesus angulatus]
MDPPCIGAPNVSESQPRSTQALRSQAIQPGDTTESTEKVQPSPRKTQTAKRRKQGMKTASAGTRQKKDEKARAQSTPLDNDAMASKQLDALCEEPSTELGSTAESATVSPAGDSESTHSDSEPRISTEVAPSPETDVLSEPESTGSDISESSIDKAQEDRIRLEKQRNVAIDDLKGLVTVEGSCLKGLYRNAASDRQIKNFLVTSGLYDFKSRTWTDIPTDPQANEDMRAPFAKVIQKIIDGLGNVRKTRSVVDTHDTSFTHYYDSTQVSMPSLAIKATGPSFAHPRNTAEPKPIAIGFSNVASVFDIRRDPDTSETDVDHLAVYTRQIMLHQQNRLFARSMLLTESQARLVHCDCSGGYKTDAIHINEEPYTLVRLILGLSSANETILGLDTSVQWKVKNGVRISGTVSTVDASGKRVKYPLSLNEPGFARTGVRGGGPVCWNARDKNGNPILLKDSWRTDSQPPEYTFLKKAQGVGGVVQMVAFDDARAQTKTFRPPCFDLSAEGFENRTMSRATLTRYGAPLHRFTSQRQVVEALRDAIKGHLNLLKAGVLHQDISIDNILFGEGGGEYKGVIIDLGMAAEVNGPSTYVPVEHPGGTYLYTSVCVLDALNPCYPALPRDYLDDLESFFYVFCHLLYGFEGPGRQAADAYKPDSVLARWEIPVLRNASLNKLHYLTMLGPECRRPPLYWSTACTELCDKLRKYLLPLVTTKVHIRDRDGRRVRKALLENLHDGLDAHYTAILALFDTALEELDKPGGTDPRAPFIPSCPSSPYSEHESGFHVPSYFGKLKKSAKRRSSRDLGDSDSDSDTPPHKRLRTTTSSSSGAESTNID